MKRILLALATLVFACTIEAALTKRPRASLRKTAPVSSASIDALPPVDHVKYGADKSSLKERISVLKQQIKTAHAEVEQNHKNILKWTQELAPLEVEAHHGKATRVRAPKVAHASVTAPAAAA